MSIPDFIMNIFERDGKVLSRVYIPDNHRLSTENRPLQTESPFVPGDDYVVLRLAEMYLKTTRVLWKESYPLVHSFVGYGDQAAPRSIASIAGPGQLKELGTDNLDRLIGLAYRLAGPIVYDGQDIELLAGLYAVPAKDGAKLLIDTLAQLSGLVPALKQATDIANIVKGGVEGLLGISGTRLALGIHDVFGGSAARRPAKAGFCVTINAPSDTVQPDQLWVRDGRLFEGPNPMAMKPFDSHDMMLFELDRGPSRAMSWATMPKLAPHATELDTIFKTNADTNELKKKLNQAFVVLETDLRAVDDLTAPDKAAIRALVAADLKERVGKIDGGGLFETRAVRGLTAKVELRGFSPSELPDVPAGIPLPKREDGVAVFS